MAELYWKQGQKEQAIAIYRDMARQNPADTALQNRLVELVESSDAQKTTLETLTNLLEETTTRIRGAWYTGVVGLDGIPVQSYCTDDCAVDVGSILAETTQSAKQLLNAKDADRSELGPTEEIILTHRDATVVLRVLRNDFVLAAILTRDALTGQARYILGKQAPKVRSALQ